MHHRWLARGFVIGLHAALLAALWLHRGPSLDRSSERRLTTVRLLPPKSADRPRPDERQPPLRAPAVARQVTTAPVQPPQPEEAAPAPAPVIVVPADTEARAIEPPRTTLRLTLPPGYAASANARRNPALDDPRANTPRATLEDRIAAATGGAGAWVEEPVENHAQAIGAVGEHRTVLRKGDTCMEVFRSRISDSDPFNRSVAPRTVAMMGKPYTCRNTKSTR